LLWRQGARVGGAPREYVDDCHVALLFIWGPHVTAGHSRFKRMLQDLRLTEYYKIIDIVLYACADHAARHRKYYIRRGADCAPKTPIARGSS